MADILSTALSSLVSHQRALATTSHNIANVDTKGYSRQEVSLVARNAQNLNGLSVGSGVEVSQVRRLYDEYASSQLRAASSAAGKFETQYQLASDLDNILADSDLGLNASLSQFFNSIQDVANEPASISARQLLLAEAQTLSNRFVDLSAQLDSIEAEVAGRVDSEVANINDLAQQIAEINTLIAGAQGSAGQSANDLSDQRDQAILKLNELLNVSTATQSDGSINVFVGHGEALVLGSQVNGLSSTANPEDPNQRDITFTSNSGKVLTDVITGGSLGGALSFQRESLGVAKNEIGRIAVAVADALNQQNTAGLDLYGDQGQAIFSAGSPRVSSLADNSGTAVFSAVITDVAALSAEDLRFSFDGSNWSVVSVQTGQAVGGISGSGSALDPFTVQGLSVSFSGAAAAGDQFVVRPTADAASGFKLVMTDPARIAAAAPTRSTADLGNTGGAAVSETVIVDPGHANLSDTVTLSFIDGSSYQLNGSGSYSYVSGQDIVINGNKITINGAPDAGDSFTISANSGASGDNRNILAMAGTEDLKSLLNGSLSITEAVSSMVGKISVYTRSAEVNLQAQENLKALAEERQASVSGVNLDEEAANLLRYQQAYSAAAQAISTANDMFQSLIGAFR